MVVKGFNFNSFLKFTSLVIIYVVAVSFICVLITCTY
nr:MAG TPA: hypothetical protein [Caudoviricetes sp.]